MQYNTAVEHRPTTFYLGNTARCSIRGLSLTILHFSPRKKPPSYVQRPQSYNVAPTSLAHASVLNDLGRSIGAPTARSMMI